jgi:hypothetical protein
MVTGLLLSYKSSSALGKWEKGKGVWIGAGAGAGGMSGGVKGEIRSAVRMVSGGGIEEFQIWPEAQISLIHPQQPEEGEQDVDDEAETSHDLTRKDDGDALFNQRAGELVSLIIGFAFALQ